MSADDFEVHGKKKALEELLLEVNLPPADVQLVLRKLKKVRGSDGVYICRLVRPGHAAVRQPAAPAPDHDALRAHV